MVMRRAILLCFICLPLPSVHGDSTAALEGAFEYQLVKSDLYGEWETYRSSRLALLGLREDRYRLSEFDDQGNERVESGDSHLEVIGANVNAVEQIRFNTILLVPTENWFWSGGDITALSVEPNGSLCIVRDVPPVCFIRKAQFRYLGRPPKR